MSLDNMYYNGYTIFMVDRRYRPKKGNTPNTSIRIDPETLHRARIAAVTERKTLGAWLAEAINEKLSRNKKETRK